MKFYPFNIGDYRKDTGHLSALEHGIYRMLLDTYYDNEGPLPADDAKLMRTHCVRTKDEKEAYFNVIRDFFYIDQNLYRQDGADKVIEKVLEKSDKARASANKRWERENAKAMRTHSECSADGMLPKVKDKVKVKSKNNNLDYSCWPEQPSQQVMEDWIRHRKAKKATVSQTVLNKMASELEQASARGYSVDYCLSVQIEAGWQGFKFDWLINREAGNGQSGRNSSSNRLSKAERIRRGAEEAFPELSGNGTIIDHEPGPAGVLGKDNS